MACGIQQPLGGLKQIAQNRAKWEAASIKNYAYQIQIICFCPFSEIPMDIEVRNGVSISIQEATGKKTGVEKFFKPYSTIEKVFNSIQQELEENAALGSDRILVSSKFDRLYGFPSHVEIVYPQPSSDANITYLIQNFQILESSNIQDADINNDWNLSIYSFGSKISVSGLNNIS